MSDILPFEIDVNPECTTPHGTDDGVATNLIDHSDGSDDEDCETDFGFTIDVVGQSTETISYSNDDAGEIQIATTYELGDDDKDDKDEEELLLEKAVIGSDIDFGVEEVTFDNSVKSGGDRKRKVAWSDDDDEVPSVVDLKKQRKIQYSTKDSHVISKKSYSDRLRRDFSDNFVNTDWADLDKRPDNSESSSEDELTHSTGDYLETSSTRLPCHLLSFNKCTDVNKSHPCKSRVKSVEFHPTSQAVLVAGMDHTLSIFQVHDKEPTKLFGVFIEHFPIYCAHFVLQGSQVILGSKHDSFRYLDIGSEKVIRVPCVKGREKVRMCRFSVSPDGQMMAFNGKNGEVHVHSASSKEWVNTFTMNGMVEATSFSADCRYLYSYGTGEVHVFDVRKRDCVNTFYDEGCVRGKSITCSSNDQYLATGEYSGAVNLYETKSCLSSSFPKPIHTFMNLTTSAQLCKFNSTNELLAIGSFWKENSIKLIHVQSRKVFSNFPIFNDKIKMPLSFDFSPHSRYFTVGNHAGKVLLYNLKHYPSY